MSVSAAAEDGGVSKAQVKRQIRSIVKDLEHILGDLKDVAKELKEVVEEIDCLTSDLRLEEDLTDGSKTDTLNSSSSSTTTASSVKIYPEETLFRPPAVLKRPTHRAQDISLMQNGDPKTSGCPQSTRERVRFSEKVQYHGYCPDCDSNSTDLHLHTELINARHSPVHQSPEIASIAFPSQKPHKTILRKSTSTTV
ncbi:protein Largen-like [Carassius auratus]|uniref:Protein Largen-like n=1 Tax=Carassius auratus TaxID=7957 RepID=A0A6P6PWT1_CARAU|nr:protein Largen-like [Carassius auratus]